MDNPKISVIIAIYNAQKTLARLLDSLLIQTMKDFEVLMVNDGSTDLSGSICDSYARTDNRFKALYVIPVSPASWSEVRLPLES